MASFGGNDEFDFSEFYPQTPSFSFDENKMIFGDEPLNAGFEAKTEFTDADLSFDGDDTTRTGRLRRVAALKHAIQIGRESQGRSCISARESVGVVVNVSNETNSSSAAQKIVHPSKERKREPYKHQQRTVRRVAA
eukprot:TRINITY_DN41612_c0_g1_i1.p1 TRINITY_DN41612_c0_g1~~TRINITY_DN41612_c0_g1_i1.p1  ORF type:complete len:136 (+),score=17.48 TRINITY_DN41612_c0_g1_i1:78-485(+)